MKTKLLNFLKNLIIILGLVVIVMMLFFTTRSYAVSQTVTVGQVMRNSISTWYNFIKEICITVYLIVYLLVCLKLLSDRTPEKNTIVKESIKHFIVMFAVLLFLHYIMIAVILLNQRGVSFAESIGTKLSGVDMKSDEYDLYETALSKAYEISSVPGFIGLLMYLLLVFYTYKFVIVYFKRYINIIVLMLLGPIIVVISTLKKLFIGINDGRIKKWFKEFIFNVIIQTLHAIFYAALIGFALSLSDVDENLVGLLLALIMFGFIFKIDSFIRKIFNAVGGSTNITTSKTAENIINGTGQAIESIGSGLHNFGENVKEDGFKSAFKESGENIKNKFKQMPREIVEKASDGFSKKITNLKEMGKEAKNDLKDWKNIIGGERVKAGLTKDEIVSEYHKMKEAKGLEGLRQKIQTVGIKGINGLKKIGKYSVGKIKSIYNKAESIIKSNIIKIQQDYNEMITNLDISIEIIKRLAKVIKKNNKKQEFIKNADGLNMNVSNAMMLAAESDVNPEDFLNELKKEFDDNLDVSNFVFDKIGAQAFLSSEVGSSVFGMLIMAEDNYEKLAEYKMDYLLTGKNVEKKKINKPSISPSNEDEEKTTKEIKNVNKVYKFNRFNSNTAKRITKIMLNKSKNRNRHLIVLSKVSEDLQLDKLKPVGKIKAKDVNVSYKMVSSKPIRKIKFEQNLAIINYKELSRKAKQIGLANDIANKSMIARNTIKLGFMQIDNMTPGQIGLRKMIKAGNAYEMPNNLIMMKKDIFGQEKIKATGVYKPEENAILQFVITETGEIVPQLVTIDGKIVKPAINEEGKIISYNNGRLKINKLDKKESNSVITRIRNKFIKDENLYEQNSLINSRKEIISNLLVKFEEIIIQNITSKGEKVDVSKLLNKLQEIVNKNILVEEIDEQLLIENIETIITQKLSIEEETKQELVKKLKDVVAQSVLVEEKEKEIDTQKLIENVKEIITQTIPEEIKDVNIQELIENIETVITQTIPEEEKKVNIQKLTEKIGTVITQTIPEEIKDVNIQELIEDIETVIIQTIPEEEKEENTQELIKQLEEVVSQAKAVEEKEIDTQKLIENVKEVITQTIPEEKEVDIQKLTENVETVITQAILEEKEVDIQKLTENVETVITQTIPEEKEVDTQKLIENVKEVIIQIIPVEEKEENTQELIKQLEEVVSQAKAVEEKEVDTQKLIEDVKEVITQAIPEEKEENTQELIKQLEEVVSQAKVVEEKEIDTQKLIEDVKEVITQAIPEEKEENTQELIKQLEEVVIQTIQSNNVDVIEPQVLMNNEKITFESSSNDVVQHIVNLEGNIIQQVVKNGNTIETENYEIISNGGNNLVQQIGEVINNDDLGLPINAPVEERVKKFEYLLQDINSHTLLEQILEDSKQKEEENELDEVIAISSLKADKTDLKHLDYNSDVDAKHFAIENMVSKGIITQEETENKDILNNAINMLNSRVEYLSSNDSDLLLDKAAEIEYARIVEQEINNNNNFTVDDNVDIETKVDDFSELLMNLSKENIQKTTEFTVEEDKVQSLKEKEKAEILFEKEIKKAEKKWAKRNNKKEEKNIYSKIENPDKNSEVKEEEIKITLKFFGAVKVQGQSIVLSNKHSIMEFYNKVDKLDSADVTKTQERFLQLYSDKLKELQLMPFTFAKCPVEQMDEWSIYVVTKYEDVSEVENYQENKISDEVEDDIMELIDKHFNSIKSIFKSFIEEHEILSFDMLYKDIEKTKQLSGKIRTYLFRIGETDSQIKATRIVNYLHKDIRFKNIMKDVCIDIGTKKLAAERVKRAKEKMELKNKKEAEEKAKKNVSNEEIDEDKKSQKKDLAQQVLDEVVEQEEKEATTNPDLQNLLNQLNENKVYVEVGKEEKKDLMRFQYKNIEGM